MMNNVAAPIKNFPSESKSKIASKNTSSRKIHSMSSAKGEELLKALLRKRAIEKVNNLMESKQVNDLKKNFMSVHNQHKNHSGKEMLKVVRKGTEKLSIKENKYKPSTHSKMCFCAPTTHEGSFRCRLHRKKSGTDKTKSNVRFNSHCARGIVAFQPKLSRFGRVPCAEVGKHDSLIKLSRVESV